MRIQVTKTRVTFRDVLNESLLETISNAFHKVAGLKAKAEGFGTTQIIEGTPEQIKQFIAAYDAEVS